MLSIAFWINQELNGNSLDVGAADLLGMLLNFYAVFSFDDLGIDIRADGGTVPRPRRAAAAAPAAVWLYDPLRQNRNLAYRVDGAELARLRRILSAGAKDLAKDGVNKIHPWYRDPRRGMWF